MPTRNVNLTDHLDRFVETNIETGRYQNASEVMREALRLLEQKQQEDRLRLERLRAAVQVGEDALARGQFVDVPLDSLGEFLAGLGETARRPRKA